MGSFVLVVVGCLLVAAGVHQWKVARIPPGWTAVPGRVVDVGTAAGLEARSPLYRLLLSGAEGDIPPLVETLDELRASLAAGSAWHTWVVRDGDGRLVASVRGRLAEGDAGAFEGRGEWEIGRLMVAPDLTGRGLGRALLRHALANADPAATRARLVTGSASARNQRMYRKAGFRPARGEPAYPGTVELVARLPRRD